MKAPTITLHMNGIQLGFAKTGYFSRIVAELGLYGHCVRVIGFVADRSR